MRYHIQCLQLLTVFAAQLFVSFCKGFLCICKCWHLPTGFVVIACRRWPPSCQRPRRCCRWAPLSLLADAGPPLVSAPAGVADGPLCHCCADAGHPLVSAPTGLDALKYTARRLLGTQHTPLLAM
jgi:hypothetical protein